jgi:hypothetical protein
MAAALAGTPGFDGYTGTEKNGAAQTVATG